MCFFFFFKQKTAYEMRISDWSSDVCSSDLFEAPRLVAFFVALRPNRQALEQAAPFDVGRKAVDRHTRLNAPHISLAQHEGAERDVPRATERDLRMFRHDSSDRKSTRLNSSH